MDVIWMREMSASKSKRAAVFSVLAWSPSFVHASLSRHIPIHQAVHLDRWLSLSRHRAPLVNSLASWQSSIRPSRSRTPKMHRLLYVHLSLSLSLSLSLAIHRAMRQALTSRRGSLHSAATAAAPSSSPRNSYLTPPRSASKYVDRSIDRPRFAYADRARRRRLPSAERPVGGRCGCSARTTEHATGQEYLRAGSAGRQAFDHRRVVVRPCARRHRTTCDPTKRASE